MPVSIHYNFSQRFNVSARKAYEWCTDYTPEDQALMQEESAKREIQHITEDILILTDTYFSENQTTTKQKLVCLYPRQLSWTSTHLTGPNKHSQFIYQIVPENKTHSLLKFTALHLDYNLKEGADEKKAERLARELKKLDSENWKLLATEMEKELRKS